MKQMTHDSIVSLHDVFEIDNDSFCTVLGLCEGDDLEAHLKARPRGWPRRGLRPPARAQVSGALAEREARVITAQIFAGLAYLSSGQRRVIHYDLKPGNVLFDGAGRVKIADFGACKELCVSGQTDSPLHRPRQASPK